jgi:hypothetical protein
MRLLQNALKNVQADDVDKGFRNPRLCAILVPQKSAEEIKMATVFIEARSKGGGPIKDYVVEDHADHVLHTSGT